MFGNNYNRFPYDILCQYSLGQPIQITYGGSLFINGTFEGFQGNAVLVDYGGPRVARIAAYTINALG